MRLKELKYLLIPFCLLFACEQNSEEEIPHLSQQKMVDVMLEMNILESHLTLQMLQPEIYKETMLRSSVPIFKKHGITAEQYEQSMKYYTSHQKELEEIYTILIDSLSTISSKILVDE